MELDEFVTVQVNVNFAELCEWMSKAGIGLHSMWCEHFGIGIVELMASGVIVIAHNSGGPKSDIVTPINQQITGMLATTQEEYAEALNHLLRCSDDELEQVRIYLYFWGISLITQLALDPSSCTRAHSEVFR